MRFATQVLRSIAIVTIALSLQSCSLIKSIFGGDDYRDRMKKTLNLEGFEFSPIAYHQTQLGSVVDNGIPRRLGCICIGNSDVQTGEVPSGKISFQRVNDTELGVGLLNTLFKSDLKVNTMDSVVMSFGVGDVYSVRRARRTSKDCDIDQMITDEVWLGDFRVLVYHKTETKLGVQAKLNEIVRDLDSVGVRYKRTVTGADTLHFPRGVYMYRTADEGDVDLVLGDDQPATTECEPKFHVPGVNFKTADTIDNASFLLHVEATHPIVRRENLGITITIDGREVFRGEGKRFDSIVTLNSLEPFRTGSTVVRVVARTGITTDTTYTWIVPVKDAVDPDVRIIEPDSHFVIVERNQRVIHVAAILHDKIRAKRVEWRAIELGRDTVVHVLGEASCVQCDNASDTLKSVLDISDLPKGVPYKLQAVGYDNAGNESTKEVRMRLRSNEVPKIDLEFVADTLQVAISQTPIFRIKGKVSAQRTGIAKVTLTLGDPKISRAEIVEHISTDGSEQKTIDLGDFAMFNLSNTALRGYQTLTVVAETEDGVSKQSIQYIRLVDDRPNDVRVLRQDDTLQLMVIGPDIHKVEVRVVSGGCVVATLDVREYTNERYLAKSIMIGKCNGITAGSGPPSHLIEIVGMDKDGKRIYTQPPMTW